MAGAKVKKPKQTLPAPTKAKSLDPALETAIGEMRAHCFVGFAMIPAEPKRLTFGGYNKRKLDPRHVEKLREDITAGCHAFEFPLKVLISCSRLVAGLRDTLPHSSLDRVRVPRLRITDWERPFACLAGQHRVHAAASLVERVEAEIAILDGRQRKLAAGTFEIAGGETVAELGERIALLKESRERFRTWPAEIYDLGMRIYPRPPFNC